VYAINQDIEIREYFSSRHTGADPQQQAQWVRIGNQLSRGGIRTMRQLCETPVERIGQIRNIGEMSLAIILEEREKYIKTR
jgi:DNA-directed RNA polymerase alpha subunit